MPSFTGLRPRKMKRRTFGPPSTGNGVPVVEVLEPIDSAKSPIGQLASSPLGPSEGDAMGNSVTVNVHIAGQTPVTVDSVQGDTSDLAARQAAVTLADELEAIKQALAAIQSGTIDDAARQALVTLADKVTQIEQQSVTRDELVGAVDGLKVMTPKDAA